MSFGFRSDGNYSPFTKMLEVNLPPAVFELSPVVNKRHTINKQLYGRPVIGHSLRLAGSLEGVADNGEM